MEQTENTSVVTTANNATVRPKVPLQKIAATKGSSDSGPGSPQVQRVLRESSEDSKSGSPRRLHESIDRDDGMKEFDPGEHDDTLGSGIPEHLAQQPGPKYIRPEIQDSLEEEGAVGETSGGDTAAG